MLCRKEEQYRLDTQIKTGRLRRLLSREEHRLLIQRTKVQFLPPTWQFKTICSSNLRASDNLLYLCRYQASTWGTYTDVDKTPVHVEYTQKFERL